VQCGYRKKDLIIRGGENISCSEVEAAVYEHSDVAEVAAFGLPDVRLGETVWHCASVLASGFSVTVGNRRSQVAVALVMKPQKRELIGEELQAFLKQTGKLANFKIPAHVFIWHEAQLPRGATGKTLKKDVRKFYADKLLTAQTSDAQPRSKL
jgi:long-chain acyl-CoA synthetase